MKIRIFIEFSPLVFLGLISTVSYFSYFFRANARKIYVGKKKNEIEALYERLRIHVKV